MATNPVLEQRPSAPHLGSNARVARVVVGLVIAAVGIVGAFRTFDPVHLSGAQLVFLLMTVIGVAMTELHIRD